jgi:Right handed beta helix region
MTLPLGAFQNPVTLSAGDNIQQAVNAYPENTTFVLQPGTYRLQSIQPKNWDTFTGQPGAILSGAQVVTSFTRMGALFAVAGQRQQGQLNGSCDQTHPRCMHPEDLFFDGRPLLHVADISQVAPGTWFFDYVNQIVYFADDPSGHTVEISTARSAFYGPASNVTVQGLVVDKYAVPAQFGAIGDQSPGPNWKVLNNEVRWNHGTGITLGDGGQASGNFVHDNGQKGIGGVGANLLVENNEICYNNWAGFDITWEAGGAKFAVATGLVLRGNHSHHNNGPGLWADIDCNNTLIEHNLVENNWGGPGIQYEISYNATIRYNTSRYNYVPNGGWWMWGAQILIQNSSNVQVYENTVDVAPTQGNAIGIIQQNRGSGQYGPHLAINNYIHHNVIIARQSPQGATGLVADWNTSVLTSGNNLFDYNAYHLSDPTQYQFAWGGGLTWDGFRAAGQERNGTIDNALPQPAPAPLAVSRRPANYGLPVSSQAVAVRRPPISR